MIVDIDKAVESVAPWDLTMTVDGVRYETRRPSIGLVVQLNALKKLADADLFSLLEQIFVVTPDATGWSMEQVIAVLSHYLAHFAQETEKNSRTVAAAVKAATVNRAKSPQT